MQNSKPTVLKRSSDFLLIKQSGKKRTPSHWMILSFKENELGVLRYGWTISTKVGNAVIRNRLKRWCREYFRTAVSDGFHPELDVNVVLRPMSKDFYKKISHEDFVRVLDKGFKSLEGKASVKTR